MTVQNGRCRDGGWEDAAGLWKGWWRDGATEGLLKVVIFKEI